MDNRHGLGLNYVPPGSPRPPQGGMIARADRAGAGVTAAGANMAAAAARAAAVPPRRMDRAPGQHITRQPAYTPSPVFESILLHTHPNVYSMALPMQIQLPKLTVGDHEFTKIPSDLPRVCAYEAFQSDDGRIAPIAVYRESRGSDAHPNAWIITDGNTHLLYEDDTSWNAAQNVLMLFYARHGHFVWEPAFGDQYQYSGQSTQPIFRNTNIYQLHHDCVTFKDVHYKRLRLVLPGYATAEPRSAVPNRPSNPPALPETPQFGPEDAQIIRRHLQSRASDHNTSRPRFRVDTHHWSSAASSGRSSRASNASQYSDAPELSRVDQLDPGRTPTAGFPRSAAHARTGRHLSWPQPGSHLG